MRKKCRVCHGSGKQWVQPCRWCTGKGYYYVPDPEPSGIELKPREHVIDFIQSLLEGDHVEKVHTWHFGRVELRKLLDHLYGEPPKNRGQEL